MFFLEVVKFIFSYYPFCGRLIMTMMIILFVVFSFHGACICSLINVFSFNDRFGVMGYILACYARGRGFDSRTVQTCALTCLLVLGLGVPMYNMYIFTK
jgi:hypothetical protein